VEQLHIDEVLRCIEGWFDDGPEATAVAPNARELQLLRRVFGEKGYGRYLNDQVNRQIIRDYLLNALVLRVITEAELQAIARRAGTAQARAWLSLQMVVNSVEAADQLLCETALDSLQVLEAVPGSPPQLVIVGG
jgi:hypothetical protein